MSAVFIFRMTASLLNCTTFPGSFWKRSTTQTSANCSFYFILNKFITTPIHKLFLLLQFALHTFPNRLVEMCVTSTFFLFLQIDTEYILDGRMSILVIYRYPYLHIFFLKDSMHLRSIGALSSRVATKYPLPESM